MAVSVWWLLSPGPTDISDEERAEGSSPAPVNATGAAHSAPSAAATSATSPTLVPSSNPSVSDFREWMEKEAANLDRLDIEAEEKRAVLRRRMAEISPAQASELLQTIKNPKSAAREKILSTYLLVEGGARTEAELTELIIGPLQENPVYAPHSEDEVKGIREKSLRIMAIDGLFSRAQTDPSAKAALARAASQAADPSIRSYASDKLRQLR